MSTLTSVNPWNIQNPAQNIRPLTKGKNCNNAALYSSETRSQAAMHHLKSCETREKHERKEQKHLSTVNGRTQSWRIAASIAPEEIVIAKTRSLSVNQPSTRKSQILTDSWLNSTTRTRKAKSQQSNFPLMCNVETSEKHQKSMYQTRGKQKQPSSLIPLSCGTSKPTTGTSTKKKK